MDYICIEITGTGERKRIDRPIWIIRNRNGILTTPHRVKALGVGDGERVWSLGALEGFPEAKRIPLAEYLEAQAEPDPDPELTAEEALNIILGGSYESK